MPQGGIRTRNACKRSTADSCVMSVRPSEWNDSAPNGRIVMICIFRKSVKKIQVSLKSDKKKGYFTWRPIYVFDLSRSVLLKMRNVHTKVTEEIKTQVLSSVKFFFRKSCRLWDNVEKYGRGRQAT